MMPKDWSDRRPVWSSTCLSGTLRNTVRQWAGSKAFARSRPEIQLFEYPPQLPLQFSGLQEILLRVSDF